MIIQKLNKEWIELSKIAWKTRENAFIYGNTKVGVSILTINKKIFSGCNIEHIFRSHDIHAEISAISNMISNGEKKIKKILLVAERDMFTPCGSCLDWIIQFSDKNTKVGFQNKRKTDIRVFEVFELMPFYPK